jgi:hypothetical protein
MSHGLRQVIHWTPRVLGVIFALFLALFSFDVFDMGLGPLEALGAFLIHSLPTFGLLAAVALGWRRPLAGGLLFLGWGVFYVFAMGGGDWIAYALIGALPALIGLLFIADHFARRPPAPHGPPAAAT